VPAAYVNEEGNTVKVCTKCDVLKDVDAFGVKKSMKDGKKPSCSECCKIAAAAYYADPEVKERYSAYRADPEVKAKRAAYRATPESKAMDRASAAKPENKAKKAVYAATPKARAQRYNYYYGLNPNAVPGAHGYRTDRPGFMYVVSGRGLLKVGITNNRDQRLSKHSNQGLTNVVHVWEFPDGADALAIEQIWKEHLETLPRVTKKQLKDGYTEATYDTHDIGDWIVQNLEPLALSA
jgi:predicted GIY-YIG superfamily endonuclease